ncbi:MAG: hypothetical protein ACE5IO_05620 [Thermoplasmata archaeon]
MHRILESVLPLVVALLALFPTYVLAMAYKRTKGRRVYWATLAFFFFILKGLIIFLGISAEAMTLEMIEFFEFSSDTAILTLFTISFVVRSGPGGVPDV